MKSSDLAKADRLIREYRKHAAMSEMTYGENKRTGYLDLGDKNIAIPDETVKEILLHEFQRIAREAAAIGLEFDE